MMPYNNTSSPAINIESPKVYPPSSFSSDSKTGLMLYPEVISAISKESLSLGGIPSSSSLESLLYSATSESTETPKHTGDLTLVGSSSSAISSRLTESNTSGQLLDSNSGGDTSRSATSYVQPSVSPTPLPTSEAPNTSGHTSVAAVRDTMPSRKATESGQSTLYQSSSLSLVYSTAIVAPSDTPSSVQQLHSHNTLFEVTTLESQTHATSVTSSSGDSDAESSSSSENDGRESTEDTSDLSVTFVTLTVSLNPTVVIHSTVLSTVYPTPSQTTQDRSSIPPISSINLDAIPTDKTYVIYTQNYQFTASYTTFNTGLPVTSVMPTEVYSTFSTPTSVITTDVGLYKAWSNNLFGNPTPSANPYKGSKKNMIIGTVLGSVCGFFFCLSVFCFMLFRKKKALRKSKAERGFTHEIGCRLDYPVTEQHDRSRGNVGVGLSADLPPLLKSKYRLGVHKKKRSESALKEFYKRRDLSNGRRASIDSTNSSNPFRDEFDFQQRTQPPPVPPRVLRPAVHMQTSRATLKLNGLFNRYSYVSSVNDETTDNLSSDIYSSESGSIPILLAPRSRSDAANPSQVTHVGSQSFLKEVL
ncbi:Tda7p Ecym_6417 [Eremothecium cymbalariae DBVPG|uniref:Topoisomerase I damage affected protein 7 n=1 Tax=Eremothecium cymbalariae (strain CBS 270.75 / DBVPG 7215 / KCTC 17166 / NRRL Y-17582) TaxID=931890 RepID=G8JUK9_ERECY|nr:hypothetical protein Ecym_6417 [Eremothecium cymbalariae DBVPG\